MAPTRQRSTSRSDQSKRWRPAWRKGAVCGYSFQGKTCRKRGAHHCEPRADKVVGFFANVLVHTKGRWARQSFVLDDWQENEIIRPLFGEVCWSVDFGCYVRRYQVAGIILGRKNGKSELAAGIVLYLLIGDDEEAAEVYGAAKDTKQARKVGDVVDRMRQLQPLLNGDGKNQGRLQNNKQARRIWDEKSASYYEVITSDAAGELGSNPSGFVLDEVLSQPDGDLWNAVRTGVGARHQPLMVVISTETNEPQSFGAEMIDEFERVQEDPSRNPRWFAYVRKTDRQADPWDEANWYWANPGLGSFLSIEALRQEALEARNDPTKENAFRQYRLNQRVSQVTRWMPLHRWDAGAGLVIPEDLKGRTCFAGLDLASTTDLAAWVLRFPATDDLPAAVLWRFWTPEAQLKNLDRYTGGKASTWVSQGFLVASEGDWIDYDGDSANGWSGSGLAIHPQIRSDHGKYRIVKVGYDQAQATATAQFMIGLGLDVHPVPQGYGLSGGLKELMRLISHDAEAQAKKPPEPLLLGHGGNPVARWNADSAEVKRDDNDRIKLVKPDRAKAGKRVDGFAALANALQVEAAYVDDTTSVYEGRGLVTA